MELFGAFDVFVDFCADHFAVLHTGLRQLALGIIALDRDIQLMCFRLFTLALQHLTRFEEVDGGEGGIVGMVSGLLQVFHTLVQLLVGHIGIAQCRQGVGRHRDVALRREVFEFGNRFFYNRPG